MPPFRIPENLNIFPNPKYADDEVVAVGGDLNPKQIETAYNFGMFPWYNEEDPVLWWSPDPRCVLYPEDLKVSKSMRQIIKKSIFRVTFNHSFKTIIEACQKTKRNAQDGTWIHPEIIEAYQELHERGIAHSIEVWKDDQIVGGLYGLSLGRVFFGESMFSTVSNASKFGFIQLVQSLQSTGFKLIDCQQETPHLLSLGATTISKKSFSNFLEKNRLFQLGNGNLEMKLF